MNQSAVSQPAQRTIIRSVALPSEHGGWGFLIEPLLLSLLIAGSINGLLLAVAALGIFLIHQPLKIALKDRLKGRRPPRLVWAERFAAGYGLLAAVPFGALLLTTDRTFLLPLVLAAPFALIKLGYDARNKSRHPTAELVGATALGSVASAIALLGGWPLLPALTLWLVLAARSLPSILYVRARLRLERGQAIDPFPTWISHTLALILVIALAAAALTPWMAVGAFAILLARAVAGLSRFRKPRRAPVIGAMEMGYGLLLVVLIALGYSTGR